MTAIAFIASGVLMAIWYALFGRAFFGGLTVWQIWWWIPFLVAGFYVARGGEARAIIGWFGLAAFWFAGFYMWSTKATYVERAFLHAGMMTYFAFIADRQSQLWISGLFMAAIGIDFLAYNDGLTLGMVRGPGFVVWSYPDLLAGISHAATIFLASPFDGGGRRIKLPLGEPGGMVRHPAHVRVHRRADPGEIEPS